MLKDFVMQSTLRSLYFPVIHPYLDYDLLNWSSVPPSNMDCLRLSNKKAVRTILSKNKQEHTLSLFKTLNFLPLDGLIKQKRGTYMWKLKNILHLPYLAPWFQLNSSIIICRIHTHKYLLTQGLDMPKDISYTQELNCGKLKSLTI